MFINYNKRLVSAASKLLYLIKFEDVVSMGEIIRVLAVDDDEFIQIIIKNAVQGFGYQVKVVGNGLDFMDAFTVGNYDLVILDINMPVMDGWNLMHQIRHNFPEPKKNIPAIALTGHTELELIERIKKSGFNFYLTKPFAPIALKNIIDQCISGEEGFAEYFDVSDASSSLHPDIHQLEFYADGDTDFLRSIVTTFNKNAPKTLGSMQAYCREKRWDELAAEAHRFSPHFGVLGIQRMASLVDSIHEEALKGRRQDALQDMIDDLEGKTGLVIEKLKQYIQKL